MYSRNRQYQCQVALHPFHQRDLALKAEHKYTFFGAVLSPASILMLTQINVKFKSVHGALAACSLLILSWYGLYDHANLIFTGFACVLS